jgi:hypothetical protein
MTSQVGSAEEIGKPWRLQELVDLSARAISNRISSGWCTLVSVVGFDDPGLRLFAKPVAASLREAKVDQSRIKQSVALSQIAGESALILSSPIQLRLQGDGYIYAASWSLAPTSSL